MTLTTQPESAPPASAQRESPSAGLLREPGDANADDPYSPGLLTLLDALGGLIGLTAILLPLATVLVARPPSPDPPADPAIVHGSEPTTGIPSARAREPGGGDPGWLAQ